MFLHRRSSSFQTQQIFLLSEKLLETFDVQEFRNANNLQGKFVITYVGAHGVANHLEQVLETGKRLEDTNALFLLIGQGMEKQRLQEKSSPYGSEKRKFIDPVPKAEVFKYILASDMGASVLKKVDTFKTVYSNKTFDYMARKKPIFMAIDGVSRALVEEADAGVYVEPENAVDFEEKVRLYLSDIEKVTLQGEKGYKFAKDNFDRQVLAHKYLEALKGIAKHV